MEMRLEHYPDSPMVYMRRTGPYGPENYGLMAAMKKWAGEKGLLSPGSVLYGIAWDDRETPPEQCRYDVCLVHDGRPPDGSPVQQGVIPGGKYAVFTIPHTAEAVTGFWRSIADNLDEEGLEADNGRPVLERYAFETVEQGLCEFCIPVLS